jgi:hypothetical protein
VVLSAKVQQEAVYSRHAHWETFDHEIAIERLEDKPTDRRVVDARIFVVLEIREVMLPDVHHRCVIARLRMRGRLLCGFVLRAHILDIERFGFRVAPNTGVRARLLELTFQKWEMENREKKTRRKTGSRWGT